MGTNPYTNLSSSAFWKTGVAQEDPYSIKDIYIKKFDIAPIAKIGTAGSCFAQHISRHLMENGYNVLDVEPPPISLPEDLRQKFGFSMYSARYGNIYTVKQLYQLSQEVIGEHVPQNFVWRKGEKFFDALRPSVEPIGLDSPEEVIEHRGYHITCVKKLLQSLDIFIFTLGLTEMWLDRESGTVYPVAPGVIAGSFDKDKYTFKNAQFGEIISDFNKFQDTLKRIRNGKTFKILLTVSPVPLTASASGEHVLTSNTFSKSTLRSVAGQLYLNQPHIDYFPSYEIVTNPALHSNSFSDNLRSVREEAVKNVMKHFFAQHPILNQSSSFGFSDHAPSENSEDAVCEEALLEAFGQ